MNKKPEIQLNFDLAIKRYKRDIRDDWFPDPLQYNDIVDVKKIQEYFSANSEAYFGEKAEQFNLPKPGFMLRYTLETSIYDRILFQAIIDKLIEIYDPLFDNRVYSHRLRKRALLRLVEEIEVKAALKGNW